MQDPPRAQDRDRLRDALQLVFGPIDESAFEEVVSELEWIDVPGGSVLFRQGESGDSLYLLLHGRLHVSLTDSETGLERLLGEVAPGEAVGEIALLTGEPRTATIQAIRDSRLVRVGRNAFDLLAARHPSMLRHLSKLVVGRLRDRTSSHRFSPRVSNIAILPLRPGGSAEAFAVDLAKALEAYGPILHLSAQRADQLLGVKDVARTSAGTTDHAKLTEWLSEQESKHRFVLLHADPDVTEWTRRCLRQADLVLIVAGSTDDPAPTHAERALLEGSEPLTTVRRALVLVHPADATEIAGTARWLTVRSVVEHHHVHAGRREDLERVARILSGNAVGLVLGGGAARGFAHIGVFRALCELGIPVDWVGGSSIGAVFAASIAMGWDADRVEDVARRAFINENPLADYTLPVISLLRGKRLDRLTHRYFEHDIEDLPLPFFCVSSNLSEAHVVVDKSGPLWRAIRSSVALPGVLPPAVSENHLVIDGGILNNLPVDVMRDRSVGKVIAVNLSVRKDYQLDYTEVPGALRVLRSRLPLARRIRVPGIVTLMLKATEVASLVHAKSVVGQADLVLNPPVGSFGILETGSFDAIVRAGYEHARERLGDWLEKGQPLRS